MKIINSSDYLRFKKKLLIYQKLTEKVNSIIQAVKAEGDKALKKYTAIYDGVVLDKFTVERSAIKIANSQLDKEILDAMMLLLMAMRYVNYVSLVIENGLENISKHWSSIKVLCLLMFLS